MSIAYRVPAGATCFSHRQITHSPTDNVMRTHSILPVDFERRASCDGYMNLSI